MTSNDMVWAWWVVAALWGVFLSLYGWNRTRLSNGIWFNMAFYSFWAVLAAQILISGNLILIYATGIPFIIFMVLLFLILAFMAILLLWNAWIVWRRESHTVANMLTLILGIAILVTPWLEQLLASHLPRFWARFLTLAPDLMIVYLLFWFYNYLTVLVLYQLYWPRLNQDAIIVLGAGLMNGHQVTPLLASRINRGIRVYQRQVAKGRPAPLLILSGGQGGDETVPEGQAMQTYAVAQGIPVADTRAEMTSRNTYENMLFSKALLPDSAKKVLFVTNNYHTLRAAIVAQQAGLKANGLGSKTAWFFLPNAIIREYIAIVNRQRTIHLVMLGLIVLGSVMVSLLAN